MAQQTDSLQQLIENLQQLERKINGGNATTDDVLEMQTIAQWIYEKTTWMKYKAMSNKEVTKEPVVEEKKAAQSLEKTKETVEEEVERPSFDFTAAFSAPKEETQEESKSNTFVEQEAPKEEISPKQEEEEEETQTSLLDAIGTDDESINESLMDEDDNSLASKMQKSPLSDIKEAVGMNDRFSYINELFEENTEAYNRAIEQLNTLNNKVEAKEQLSEMAVQYDWDLENKLVQKFVEIVERRYS